MPIPKMMASINKNFVFINVIEMNKNYEAYDAGHNPRFNGTKKFLAGKKLEEDIYNARLLFSNTASPALTVTFESMAL